jgi:hypothetical protein
LKVLPFMNLLHIVKWLAAAISWHRKVSPEGLKLSHPPSTSGQKKRFALSPRKRTLLRQRSASIVGTRWAHAPERRKQRWETTTNPSVQANNKWQITNDLIQRVAERVHCQL